MRTSRSLALDLKWGHEAESCGGFTLLELMVVIVLIGILTAAILPEMRGTYQDALLRSSSRELINVINLASCRAVSLNQVHRVVLDERTGHYQLERRLRSPATGDEFVKVDDDTACAGELDERISMKLHRPVQALENEASDEATPPATEIDAAEGQPDAIGFYPDGTTDGGEIELQDRDGFRFVLRLNPVTSRVHVVEVGKE